VSLPTVFCLFLALFLPDPKLEFRGRFPHRRLAQIEGFGGRLEVTGFELGGFEIEGDPIERRMERKWGWD
jgi:hypothetical protein